MMGNEIMRAAIIDDEPLALDLLEKTLLDTGQMKVVGRFTDPEIAMAEIGRLQPDILFLDVEMPEMNGIEVGTALIGADYQQDMSIVFVTAFEQYAIHAFALNAIHYILKPADSQAVLEVVRRVQQKQGAERNHSGADGALVLFGSIHIQMNGVKIERLTGKIEELLALLIINREKGISKWSLMDILWENSSMEKSLQNLHTNIYRLKKTLRSAGLLTHIKCKNNVYTIELVNGYCDMIEFDRITKQGLQVNEQNVKQFEKAISLYQGDLLEGQDYVWGISYREHYYQQFRDIILNIAAYYISNNQLDMLQELHRNVKHLMIEDHFPFIQKVLE